VPWPWPAITGGSPGAETLRRQDPRARTAQVSWAGSSPVPVWLDQAREVSEQWIHRQQLRQAVGRPSDLRADLAGPVLDALRWARPYRLTQRPAKPGDAVTIAISGPVTRTWQIVATAAGWKYHDQPGARVVASLSMTTEQAWRLLTNNMPAAGRSSRRIRLSLAGATGPGASETTGLGPRRCLRGRALPYRLCDRLEYTRPPGIGNARSRVWRAVTGFETSPAW
jgi:hypothetical protein